MMINTIFGQLNDAGYTPYDKSLRKLSDGSLLMVAAHGGKKYIALVQSQSGIRLADEIGPQDLKLPSGESITLHPLTWNNYIHLKKVLPLAPSTCTKQASFGTGDRLGMVTAAHLEVHSKYPVFPIIAQQSPRELERTNRTFKSVLLDAVMGILESGYVGEFGADADHIKDESRFMEGVEAGYSMYTLDVSDQISSPDKSCACSLSELSRKIVGEYSGKTMSISDGAEYTFSEDGLIESALVFEKSMMQAARFHGMAKTKLDEFDLEISIDEGSRDTTAEDHLFVAEFLHRNNVGFSSLAPKFPGEFQKAVDYKGDLNQLERSFNIHAEIARMIGGYRLSMHSGSDKFSVYEMFGKATMGNFHIKTSGTSWLQAVRTIAHTNTPLFKEMYRICLDTLPESKKAYHVDITPADFPTLPPHNVEIFITKPNVAQLFHISYGALLEARRSDIIDTLIKNEGQHYVFVKEHIGRHLDLLFVE